MMDFLTEWMRGLILVIFLAVFLDMVLPNNAMQRYAKVVMGLLVILMMLSPVIKVYGGSIYEMDFSLDTLLHGGNHGEEKGIPTIDQIQAEGDKLRQGANGITVDEWKSMIAQEIKQRIEQDQPVTVAQVELTIKTDNSGQPTAVDSIRLSVEDKVEPGAVKPVQPVAPVVIGGDGSQAADSRAVLTDDQRGKIAAIRDEVAAEYKLSKSKVDVQWRQT